MYLQKDNHISRHAPYKKCIRDENDKPIGLLPQAFEMRAERNEKALSVNWLEYYKDTHVQNVTKMVTDFRTTRTVGLNSAFGIANVGELELACATMNQTSVRILYDSKATSKTKSSNASHATIIRLPFNDDDFQSILSSNIFTEIIPNSSIP
ncbi:MAG: hypothetical protein JKY11_09340 [Alphaproteobacteria bacterium]|nr:hypothetical protein [Alphaproteobacteria bacterium]